MQTGHNALGLPGRTFIARHGETVFNAAKRLQGDAVHTPLTRAGFEQAKAFGRVLQNIVGRRPALQLWSSNTGRALQTLAIIVEQLDLDWHTTQVDDRLAEIAMGQWGGRYYAEVRQEFGPIVDEARHLLRPAPDGEHYPAIAARVTAWAQDAAHHAGDRLVIMHGISSRVLRGVLLGLPIDPDYGAPIAGHLPQGSIVCIAGGEETVIGLGSGDAPA